jgi:hypothetical protein
MVRQRSKTTSLFAIRSHFEFAKAKENLGIENIYEERIVVVRAKSHEDALRQGEAEADAYVGNGSGRRLHLIESYELFDTKLKLGVEIFSHLRGSQLNKESYLRSYFHGHDIEEGQRRFEASRKSMNAVQPK